MTAPELNPCPFCGNTNQDSILIEHLEGTVRHPAYRVMCDYCGASTGHTDHGDHVAKWNTRTPTLSDALAVPEVKALVEAAEALRNNFGSYKFNSMGDFYCTSKDPEFRQFDEALAALTTAPVDGENK